MPFKCALCGKRVIQAPNYMVQIGCQFKAICNSCADAGKQTSLEAKQKSEQP